MSKARDLADFVSAGSPLADGTISVSEVSGAAPTANPSFTGTVTSGDVDMVNSQNAETKLEVTNTNTGADAQVRTKYTTDGGLFTVGKTSDAHSFGGDAYVHNVDNTNIRFATSDAERFRIGSSGQLGIGGANYGTAGQVLKSNGSGAAPSWGEGGASTGKAIAMAIVFG